MQALSNHKYNPLMTNIQVTSVLNVNTFLTKMFHVEHWDRVEAERKQKLQREYQEMDDIAQKIEKDREEFRRILDRVLDNPVNRFIDNVAIPIFVFATIKQPYSPACASMTATARVVAPRMGQVATTLGTVEISRELTTFFNKKAGSEIGKKSSTGDAPRVIPTHDMQRTFIESKVKSKEWTKLSGRMLYEDKAGYRYIPTKEKFEFEVGKKIHGKWTHIGILRGEGEEAGKILRRFGKGLSHGRYFE